MPIWRWSSPTMPTCAKPATWSRLEPPRRSPTIRRFAAPTSAIDGTHDARAAAAGVLGSRRRLDLCQHRAGAGDDLSLDRPGEFRARRNGDVLDLYRLDAGECRPAVLGRVC